MKTTKLVMLVMTIAVALFTLIPNLSWAADDGATLYKAKCAACHGADAAGKPAAHIVGISMGGMIAQEFVATYPERTLSLTSIMSSTEIGRAHV